MIGFLDENKVKQIIDLVLEFLAKQYGNPTTALRDGMFKPEDYKPKVHYRANEVLRTDTWNSRMIRSGEIAERMADAIYVKDNNLISWQNKDHFRKMLKERPVEGSQVLFDLFKKENESETLEELVVFLGHRWYDLISTLFYLKNPKDCLPCRPRFFKEAFSKLGMDTSCFKSCTYENYVSFNDGIKAITSFFSTYVDHIDLIDGHSFVWMLCAYKEIKEYVFGPQETNKESDGKKREGKGFVKTRLRQSEFRKNLLEYWEEQCAVTGCNLTKILIASHTKPWSQCTTNQESVSKYNGLLLTPNLDRLFDQGLISFDNHGTIMISPAIPENEFDRLGISQDMKLRKIEIGHIDYLTYHRRFIFRE